MREESSTTAKPIELSKRSVWEAWLKVKRNGGSSGVDRQTIEEIDKNPGKYLYKVWNRLSSGSYFPPAVKAVAIPKKSGGTRTLGIPTVLDRIAQTVVKDVIEPLLEPVFHEDSFGYRPNRSAIDAVAKTRQRCWQYGWLIEFDIRGLFDNIDHNLLLKALKHHCDIWWVHLYIERWLKAPMYTAEGEMQKRTAGTPQGGVVSPILANLFMHYAFDHWLAINYPTIPFVRYADDGLLHCTSKQQADFLLSKLSERMADVGLELHPQKTKIVFCKMNGRYSTHKQCSFDFLGFTFKPRMVRSREGKMFLSFTPGVSSSAKQAMRKTIRNWKLHFRNKDSLEDLAAAINPVLRGWSNYYGRFNKSSLRDVWDDLNWRLAKWVGRKYKRLKTRRTKCIYLLGNVAKAKPRLFVHWELNCKPTAG